VHALEGPGDDDRDRDRDRDRVRDRDRDRVRDRDRDRVRDRDRDRDRDCDLRYLLRARLGVRARAVVLPGALFAFGHQREGGGARAGGDELRSGATLHLRGWLSDVRVPLHSTSVRARVLERQGLPAAASVALMLLKRHTLNRKLTTSPSCMT
jgi:hypothetical protein